MLPGRLLVRRVPPDDTFIEGGSLVVPEKHKADLSTKCDRGIVISCGKPRYLAHKWDIDMKQWPVSVGEMVLFSSHGAGGVLDAGVLGGDGYEYVLVMYHELLAVLS